MSSVMFDVLCVFDLSVIGFVDIFWAVGVPLEVGE